MGLDVVAMTSASPEFYPLLGPFLSRRAVTAELGGPVWDDDGKTWIVAVSAGEVAGFCAAVPAAKYVLFCSDYVLPGFRRRSVYRRLAAARDEMFPGAARAVVTSPALHCYLESGFTVVRPRGRYTEVRRDA